MVQGRAAGNGNFDIDAIRMAANAMENAPAVIDQPFVDPVADAFAADVQDTADEIRYNPGSNLAEEAMQIMNAPGAAKLGAGVMADLRAAVQLQEEKAANGADAFMRGDRVWEERKERDDKDRKEQARVADMADDAQSVSQQREAEIARREEEFANVDVAMGDITMTGRNWRAAAMMMRDQSFRREMEAWARVRGYTDAQIEEAANISEEIMLKNARGEPLTPGEQRAYEENELVQRNIRMAAEQVQPGVTVAADANASLASSDARSYDPLASTNASLDVLAGNGPAAISTDANPTVATRLSVSAQLNNQENFAGAPSLTQSFGNANAALAPLDSRQPQVAIAASVATIVPANAGLDI
jgi:hypothetical protein